MQRSIKNKEQFKNFILTQLGDEYNCVEISDKQLDNIIEMTIQKYSEYAYDGLKERVYLLPIVEGQREYVIGDDNTEPEIYSIFDVIQETRLNTLLLNYNFGDSTMMINTVGSNKFWHRFLDYEIFGGYLELYNKIYSKKVSFNWDEPTQTFYIYDEPEEDETFALMVNQYHGSNMGLWNKNWVKEYATEQARFQWGKNLMKMTNVSLPGGIQLNDAEIRSLAKEEITRLDEELQNNLTAPSEFFVG